MSFTPKQIGDLTAPLKSSNVKERSQSGRTLSYIEGWHAIAEANRIFGFDGWSRETIELKPVSESARTVGASKANGWGVTYFARVRVTVGEIVREGCGTGHGIDRDLGQAHESAMKEAETDAMKRAFMTFGNQFGLALYDKTQANVVDFEELHEPSQRQNPHVTRPEDVSDAKPRYNASGERIDWIDTSVHRVERLSKAKARPVAASLNDAMRLSRTVEELVQFGVENAEAVASLPLDWEEIFQSRYQEFLDELRTKKEAAE